MLDDTPDQAKGDFGVPIHNIIPTDVNQFYLQQKTKNVVCRAATWEKVAEMTPKEE